MTLRERIARDYGVSLHLVPEPRVIPTGTTGWPADKVVTPRQALKQQFAALGRRARMRALLRREGKL